MADPPSPSLRSSMQSRRKSLGMEISRDGLPRPASYDDTASTTDESPFSSPITGFSEIACSIVEAEDGAEDDAVVFTFLNEGAANAVFCLRPYQAHDDVGFVFVRNGQNVPRSEVLGRVLRISKGKPKTLTSEEIVRDFENEVRPLFRPKESGDLPGNHDTLIHQGLQDPDKLYPNRSFENFLMEHELVHVPRSVLEVLFGAKYDLLEIPLMPLDEERGILLPDMSLVPGVSLTVELKPKWLAPSPNAPKSAYRCRTCALQAKRLAETKTDSPPYLCPLQLVRGNKKLIRNVILDKLQDHHERDVIESVADKAVDYLTTGPGKDILSHLRHLQLQLDPAGALSKPEYPQDKDAVLHRLRLAMTLRDCSLFLRVPYADTTTPIEAKLVDLDFKSPFKQLDWQDKEKRLINGGWYTNLKAGVDQCLLAEGWRHWCPHYI